MLPLAILALVGVCSCDAEFDYHADQDNVTLTSLPNNDYIKLADSENGRPTGIEYLKDIDSDTGLMVRMLLGNDDDFPDPENDNSTRMNICDVLDKAIDEPNSLQARYHMPESLGLMTTRCPILQGIKVLSPYEFPSDFTSNDIGSGPSFYLIRVETANQGPDTQAIMEMRVDLTLTIINATTNKENSSSKLSIPSITSIIAVGSMVFQLNNGNLWLIDN